MLRVIHVLYMYILAYGSEQHRDDVEAVKESRTESVHGDDTSSGSGGYDIHEGLW